MSDTPPRVLDSRVAFQGRVFDVQIDRVRLREGLDTDIAVVRHRPCVVLLPMPDPAHVVLIRQYRHPVARWLWEVPAGTLEPGEEPDAAARRECEEETGLAPARVERLGSFFPSPGYCDEEMIFYRVTGLSRPERPAAPDEDEQIEVRVVRLEEARAMVRSGAILDLKSALALTLF